MYERENVYPFVYKDNLAIEVARSFEKSSDILTVYLMSAFELLIFVIINNINKVEISKKDHTF